MTTSEDSMEFQIWLENGVSRGWISKPFCETHEGGPMSDEEMEEWENGQDPCAFHIKLLGE